ncbi:MAG: Stp1/IreP family PP2C-type Ser/Thr phosphatase, partial [Nitrospiria bacterium]
TTIGVTDVGCVRSSNEDSLGLFPDLNLYIVADGMGGHAAGEVASKMAVDMIREFFMAHQGRSDTGTPELTQSSKEALMPQAITYANQCIYEAACRDKSLTGMGTTVVALLADPTELIIGFVGDSRVYLHNKDQIKQLTRDHSLVNEYVRQGLLTPEAAESHPLKHILSRALGTNPKVEVETFKRIPLPGDVLILCSDGLSNKLAPQAMNAIMMENGNDLEKGGNALVQKAKENGGEDNITAILVGYHETACDR